MQIDCAVMYFLCAKKQMMIENSLPGNLLNDVEGISSAASACNLNFSNLAETSDAVARIAEFLGITCEQAILHSCCVELSLQKTVTLENLAKHLKTSTLQVINLMQPIGDLEQKGYVEKSFRSNRRKHSYNDFGFSVPYHVIEALRTGDKTKLIRQVKFDLPNFLERVSDLVTERGEDKITTATLCNELEFLVSNNLEHEFVTLVNASLAATISKSLVFAVAFCCLKGTGPVDISGVTSALCDDFADQLDFSQSLCTGNHETIRKEFLQVVDSGFMDSKHVTLTPRVSKKLYQDYPALLMAEKQDNNYITAGSVTPKQLFFNHETEDQLTGINRVLEPRKFRTYLKELKRNAMKPGMTIIFDGPSGTGKTEAVYQVARNTGRDIMMVDLSAVRSKWFGESEKQARKVFDDYAVLLKNSTVEPILFINEADGFFSKRMENTGRGSSTDQTMNTLQNIMLQGLENFEGILMATTNLAGNLDKAFERRFMFRVRFPKPDCVTRQKIWESKLPELTPEKAAILGERYALTGGQIDNQVRQVVLKRVLNRKLDQFAFLLENCARDTGFDERKRIGF